jgi:hypothetical protein
VVESLQTEIENANIAERRLELELQDCLTDVTTPEVSSDDEGPDEVPLEGDPVINVGDSSEAAVEQLNIFLQSRVVPSDVNSSIFPLYMIPQYRQHANRKLRKLRKVAMTTNFCQAFNCKKFWRHYTRVRDLYPVHGGREDLNGLVAYYCYVDDLKKGKTDDEDEDESELSLESGSEAESDNEDPPAPGPGQPMVVV